MNLQEKIEKGISSGMPFRDQYNRINFIFINEFKWSYHELMETPIPFVLDMLDSWNTLKIEERKQSKLRRR